MKPSITLIFTAILICNYFSLISGVDVEDIEARQAFVQCSEIHQIREEVLMSIRNHRIIPDDQDLKCWLGCVFKKLGLIKNGKIDWSSSVPLAKLCPSIEQDQSRTEKVVKICQSQVPQDEKDECQLAYSAAVCKLKTWNELESSKMDD